MCACVRECVCERERKRGKGVAEFSISSIKDRKPASGNERHQLATMCLVSLHARARRYLKEREREREGGGGNRGNLR